MKLMCALAFWILLSQLTYHVGTSVLLDVAHVDNQGVRKHGSRGNVNGQSRNMHRRRMRSLDTVPFPEKIHLFVCLFVCLN